MAKIPVTESNPNAPSRAIWAKEVMIWILGLVLGVQFFFDNNHEIATNDQWNQQEIIKILLDQDQDFDKLYNVTLDLSVWMDDLKKEVSLLRSEVWILKPTVSENREDIDKIKVDIDEILLKLNEWK